MLSAHWQTVHDRTSEAHSTSGLPPSVNARATATEHRHRQLLIRMLEKTVSVFWILLGICDGKVSEKFRENQTCTNLRATIPRHVLPPIFRWQKTVDSCWSFCRNSRTSQLPRETGRFPVPGKRHFPFGKGGRTRHKTVTAIWCMFSSP